MDYTVFVGVIVISIHALRKESDAYLLYHITMLSEFQSTLSVRRATLRLRL